MCKSNKNKEKSSKKTNNILFEDFELLDLDKNVDILKIDTLKENYYY